MDLVLTKIKGRKNAFGQVEHPQDLIADLLGQAKDVGVVLGESPYPHQAVHHPRPFIAIDGAQFGPADR